jgi:Zn-dependent alcohol dehydrogenase
MSGDTDHYYKALQFIKHNRHRFSFEDMLSHRYPLDHINEALEAMRAFREVKAVVVP